MPKKMPPTVTTNNDVGEARLKAAGIPERIARIPEASPDLLSVILKEGKV